MKKLQYVIVGVLEEAEGITNIITEDRILDAAITVGYDENSLDDLTEILCNKFNREKVIYDISTNLLVDMVDGQIPDDGQEWVYIPKLSKAAKTAKPLMSQEDIEDLLALAEED